jgi:hypothetical protein
LTGSGVTITEAARQESRIMIAKTKCQHCGNEFEIDGMNRTEFCPTCGKETSVFTPTPVRALPPATNPLHMALAIIIFLILFVGVSVFVLTRPSGSDSSAAGDAPAVNNSPDVSISDVQSDFPDFGGMKVTGLIKNLTAQTLEAVTVNYGLYDSDGNKVDDVMDFISLIQAGESWKFDATTLKKDCKTFQLESITSIFNNRQVTLKIQQ